MYDFNAYIHFFKIQAIRPFNKETFLTNDLGVSSYAVAHIALDVANSVSGQKSVFLIRCDIVFAMNYQNQFLSGKWSFLKTWEHIFFKR